MSPNGLRVLAGAAVAVLALLTAVAVGLAGRPLECVATTPAPAPTAATPAAPTPTATTGGPGGSLGGTVGADRERPAPTAAPTTATAQAAPTQAPAARVCTPGKFRSIAAAVALLGTGLAGFLVLGLMLLAGRGRTAPAVPAVRPVSVPPVSAPPMSDAAPRLDADRAALVRACIYVRDRVTSRALSDRLATALQDAGVVAVEPVGDRFDPGRHEAGGATPAADPSLTGTIAAVEVPGYVDRGGRVLRAPVVTVYQAGPSGGPAKPPANSDRSRTEEVQ
jgi:hypothetical protein